MIPKSGYRFSEKIMLMENARARLGSSPVRATTKNPGASQRRGSSFHTLRLTTQRYIYKDSRQARLQLTIFTQHRAAFVADAPAMRGKRRATAQKVAPGHATGVVAQAGRGRLARSELRKIDCIGRCCGNAD